MDYLNDCNLYLNSRQDFIKDLRLYLPKTSYRFDAPIVIIDYITKMYNKKNNIDDELQNILENCFSYLYEFLEILSIFQKNYFSNSFKEMSQYDTLINNTLYLEDILSIIKSDELADNINSLLNSYEHIMMVKDKYDDSLFEKIESLLLEYNDDKLFSQQEVFEMIVEELEDEHQAQPVACSSLHLA